MSSYGEAELKVIRWSEARGIIPNSTAIAQARKAHEEVGELLEALSAHSVVQEVAAKFPDVAIRDEFREIQRKSWNAVIDAIGDVEVCMINVCALLDVDKTRCLYEAYEQIKDRKGYMNKDGIFVKEQKHDR